MKSTFFLIALLCQFVANTQTPGLEWAKVHGAPTNSDILSSVDTDSNS
ncbi:MAG TPA: hypothetical protein VK625_05580 [Flavitalea sp.]|nr:hypothetical protein [Flavitalea sp.]